MQDDTTRQEATLVQLLDSMSVGALLKALGERRRFVYKLAIAGLLLGILAGLFLSRGAQSVASVRDTAVARYIDIQIPEVFTLTAVDVVQRLRHDLTSYELLTAAVEEVRARSTSPYINLFRPRIEIDRLKLKVDEQLNITLESPHPAVGEEILASLIRRATERTNETLRSDVRARVEFERRRSQYLVDTNKPRFDGAVGAQITKLNEEMGGKSSLTINSNLREVGKELFVDEYSKHVQRLKFLEDVKVEAINFKLADIDRPPGTPQWSELRHIASTAALGAALGLLLGLMLVFYRVISHAITHTVRDGD